MVKDGVVVRAWSPSGLVPDRLSHRRGTMSKFFQLFLFFCFLENNRPVSLGSCEDPMTLPSFFNWRIIALQCCVGFCRRTR